MDSLVTGIEPGTAAPASGTPHGLVPLGAYRHAATSVARNDDAVRLAGADGIGAKKGPGDKRDCAADRGVDQAHAVIHSENKRFSTLRARLALAGYTLSRTQAGDGQIRFYVTRWNLTRELRDLTAVEAFAFQAGARP